jgi:hypothetical protein
MSQQAANQLLGLLFLALAGYGCVKMLVDTGIACLSHVK